jgi:membrane peptidoglycan carboxypeptidase
LFVVLPVVALVFGGIYVGIAYQRIDLDRQLEQPSVMLDRDGQDIGRFSAEIRQVITLDQMSPRLIEATIAIEDSRFFEHQGIDPRGIARALWRNFLGRRVVEGGSTITQQLAKNEYFIGSQGPARTFERKLREAVYAIKLERTFTKDEILERYLNRIYFGHGRFGVEAASQFYFGKPASDLNLSEASLLAGIPNGPAIFSLRDNPQQSNQRRDLVLARMHELGLITTLELEEARAQTLAAVDPKERPARASHFRLRVEREVRQILGERFPGLEDKEITNLIYNQGLQIHTTLSLSAQAAAEQMIKERGPDLLDRNEHIQAAVVAINPATGGIMALVESIELTGTYRRADATYELGSSFKGVLYTAALENGYTASSTVLCQQTAFPNPQGRPNPFQPSDFDGGWHNRDLRVREALEVSCNLVAVKVGLDIGMNKFLDMAARLNPRLAQNNIGKPYELQLPLGPRASTMNLTLTYAPIVNGGYTVEPHTVTEIRDKDGNTLYQKWPRRQLVLDPRLGYIVTQMLQGVQGIRGTLPFDAAGKTGTSGDGNVVFVGFTSDMVASVFFGFDNPDQATNIGNAASLAAPAWRSFVSMAYQQDGPEPFTRPVGIEEAVVCTISGELATPFCPDSYVELFMPGTMPTQRCRVHTGNLVEICTVTNLPAGPWCPAAVRRLEQREPWMRNIQCWFHGPAPGDPPGEGPGPPDDDEEDELPDEEDEDE